MRKILVRFAFLAALSLAPSTGHAASGVPCTPVEFVATGTCYSWWPEIPDEPLCSDYIKAWIAMAKAASAKRCSPGGAMWATVYTSKNQGDYCLSAGTDANNARTAEMQRVMSVCDACSQTVDDIIHDVVDNALYGCGLERGFSNSDGRWSTSRESQINRCVAAATLGGQATLDAYLKIKAQMSEDVRVCKLTHERKGCASCHNSGSSAAVQAIPRGGAVFQDTIQRLKRPIKTSTQSGNDLSSPSETIYRRATLPKGSNTSANDLANPSGGTARRAANPCQSPTAAKPCKPAARLLGPGLLESGPVFSPQGPAPTGSPMGGSPSSGGSTRIR